MPKRKIDFIDGEIYHITTRGVDKRQIFMDNEDYWRGIFSLYEFNTTNSVTIRRQREKREKFKELIKSRRVPDSAALQLDTRIRLVDILGFVLMPNHIHLILRQLKTCGVAQFVKKLCLGYAMYFNGRYQRSGTLFQGRFGASHIEGNEYFKNAFVYVHINPISIIEPSWKQNGIFDANKAKEFLKTYKWSSLPDYIGIKNFPSLSARDFGLKVFSGSDVNYVEEGGKIIEKFINSHIDSNLAESRTLRR